MTTIAWLYMKVLEAPMNKRDLQEISKEMDVIENQLSILDTSNSFENSQHDSLLYRLCALEQDLSRALKIAQRQRFFIVNDDVVL